MKLLFAALVICVWTTAGGAQTSAPAPGPVTKVMFFDHTKTAEVFANGGPLVTAADMIVQGSHRTANGEVEVHDKQADVIYVIDGAATFVAGGTMVGGRANGPGQWLGTDITGGETHQLVKGDMIIVPAGTPHWFKAVPTSVSYFVVKVVKP